MLREFRITPEDLQIRVVVYVWLAVHGGEQGREQLWRQPLPIVVCQVVVEVEEKTAGQTVFTTRRAVGMQARDGWVQS